MPQSWGFFSSAPCVCKCLRYIEAMSPLTPSPKSAAGRTPPKAVANAAAASFAALEAQLGYLSEAETDMVRRAYKLAG